MSTSTLLRYLPAVYGEPEAGPEESGFIGAYLKIFEKLLLGREDVLLEGRKGIQQLLSAEVIGNLFYPRFSFLFAGQEPPNTQFIPPISAAPPPTREQLLAQFNSFIGIAGSADPLAQFLSAGAQEASWQSEFEAWLNDYLCWLGGWVALVSDRNWSIDKKRNVIAQSMALYRLRGTPQGLSLLIDLLCDLPLTVSGQVYAPGSQTATPVEGQVVVTVTNPTPAPISVSAVAATAFVLRERWQSGDPVVGGYSPWLFVVTVQLPNARNPTFILTSDAVQQVLALMRQLALLVAEHKPAASRVGFVIVPSMQLQQPARATQLGVNTLLGTSI